MSHTNQTTSKANGRDTFLRDLSIAVLGEAYAGSGDLPDDYKPQTFRLDVPMLAGSGVSVSQPERDGDGVLTLMLSDGAMERLLAEINRHRNGRRA